MEAISKEYLKLNKIVNSKIPVSEDSPIYGYFEHRRKVAERLRNDMLTEEARACVLESFNHLEHKIKEYLHL